MKTEQALNKSQNLTPEGGELGLLSDLDIMMTAMGIDKGEDILDKAFEFLSLTGGEVERNVMENFAKTFSEGRDSQNNGKRAIRGEKERRQMDEDLKDGSLGDANQRALKVNYDGESNRKAYLRDTDAYASPNIEMLCQDSETEVVNAHPSVRMLRRKFEGSRLDCTPLSEDKPKNRHRNPFPSTPAGSQNILKNSGCREVDKFEEVLEIVAFPEKLCLAGDPVKAKKKGLVHHVVTKFSGNNRNVAPAWISPAYLYDQDSVMVGSDAVEVSHGPLELPYEINRNDSLVSVTSSVSSAASTFSSQIEPGCFTPNVIQRKPIKKKNLLERFTVMKNAKE